MFSDVKIKSSYKLLQGRVALCSTCTAQTNKLNSVSALILLVFFIIGSISNVQAATKTWNGTTSSDWNTGSNWSTAAIPAAGDDVLIPGGTPNNPSITAAVTVATLNINNTGTTASVSISSVGSLNVTTTLTISANGTLILRGGGTVSSAAIVLNGILDVQSGTFDASGTGVDLVVAGTLKVSGGIVQTPSNKGISGAGTIDISGGKVIVGSAGAGDLKTTGNSTMSGGLLQIGHDFKPSNFSATGGTVEFLGLGGNGTFPAGSTYQFHNILVTADPEFDNRADIIIKVSGNWIANAVCNLSQNTTTVEFNGSGDQTIGGTQSTTFDNVIFSGVGKKTLSFNTNVSGNLIVKGGSTLDLSSFTLGSPTSVTMETGTPGATITGTTGILTLGGNVNINSTSGTSGVVISCYVALGTAARTFTIADSPGVTNDLSVTGIMTGIAAADITKAGTGTMLLSGNNSYIGKTTISAGTLALGAEGTAPNSPLGTITEGTVVSSDATLDLNGFTLSTAEALTITGVGVSSVGALLNSSLTPVSYSGLITLGGASSIIAAGGDISLTNTGTITGATFGLTLGGTYNGSVSSIIGTTSGTLTKSGTGTWVLSGLNTYTGTTSISAGTLKLGSATALGTSSATAVSSGAALDLNGNTLTTARPLTINGSGLTASPAGALTNTGTNASFSGNITLGASSKITASSSGTLTCSGAVGGAFPLTLDGSGTGSMTGIISTPTSLTKNGTGTWTLSGLNTYTGTTTIAAGTLKLGVSSALTAAGPLGTGVGGTSISSGAVLDLNGFSLTGTYTESVTLNGSGLIALPAGALTNTSGTPSTFICPITLGSATTITAPASSGTLTCSGAVGGAFALTLDGSGTGAMTGIISTPTSLTKNGTGTWTLSGLNTYTGTTTIAAGTLKLGVSSALTAAGPLGTGAGGTSISSGAVLDLNGFSITGTYTESVTLNGSGLTALPAGALTNTSVNPSTFICPITLGSSATITAPGSSGTLTCSGNVDGAFALTLDGDGSGTMSGIISTLTSLTKNGISTWSLSGANTYSGLNKISSGILRIGSADRITDNSTLELNGGTFSSGATTGFSETINTLSLTSSSTIALGTGQHSVKFSSSAGLPWTASQKISVTGWAGNFDGTSGTAGKIFVGNDANGLTSTQLVQVFFRDGTLDVGAIILSNGEVVPKSVPVSNLSYPTPNSFTAGTALSSLIPTVTPGTGTVAYSISPALPAGLSLNAGTGEISGTPTTTMAATIYRVTATGYRSSSTYFDLSIAIFPGAPTQIVIGTIGNQIAGTSFSVTVTAKDANNNIAPVSLPMDIEINTVTGNDDVTGTVSGTIAALSSTLTISGILYNTAEAGVSLSASQINVVTPLVSTDTSNTFTVSPGPLNKFLIEEVTGGDIGAQTSTVSFPIKITAQDAYENTITSFTGAGKTVTITSNGTLTQGSGTTAQFTNGILVSHSITISNTGKFTITATNGIATTSNFFDVGAIRYAVANGNWNAAIWASTSTGTANLANVPGSADIAVIQDTRTIAVSAPASCKAINFTGKTGTLTINSGFSLFVADEIKVNNYAANAVSITINGGGTLNCDSIALGGTISPTAKNIPTTLVSDISALNVAGNITIKGLDGAGRASTANTTSFNLGSGIVSVGGGINYVGQNNSVGTFNMTAGAQTGTLNLSGTNPQFNISSSNNTGKVAYTVNLNGTSSRVNFNGVSTNQTIPVTYQSNKNKAAAAVTSALPYKSLTVSNGGIKTLSGDANVSGNLTVNAGTTLNLGGFALSTPTSITLEAGSAGSVIGGTGLLTLGGGVTVNAVLGGTGNGAIISCPVALGATRTFTVADDGTVAADLVISGIVSGNNFGITKVGGGQMELSGANSYTGAVLISTGTLTASNNTALGTVAGGVTVTSGAVLALANNITIGAEALSLGGVGVSGNAALDNTGDNIYGGTITLSSTAAIRNVSGNFTLNNASAIVLGSFSVSLGGNSSGGLVSGAISGTGDGTSAVRKVTDAGTWTLSGVNTYTGPTLINAGTLKLGSTTALGTSSSTVVSSGAVLDLNGFAISTARPLTINGTGLTASPAGALTNTGGNASFSGAITLATASTITATTSGTLTCSGNVSGAALGLTLGGAGNGTMSGIIGTTSGTLTKEGEGDWSLFGVNTYSGATTINAGSLTAKNNAALGTTASKTTVNAGCTLFVDAGLTIADPLTLNGGTLRTVATTPTIANSTYSGAITQTAGSTIQTGGSHNLIVSGTIDNGGLDLELTSPISTTLTVSNAISGSGKLVKNQLGMVILSGANTYTGATEVNVGTLKAGSTAAFGSNSAVVMANANSAILDITGFNNTIGSLTGGGSTAGNIILGAATLTIGSDNTSPAAHAAIISGTGGIAKTGTGTLTLSGNNSYSGTTTISSGILTVASSNALGTTASGTVVGSGASLMVDGGITVGAEALSHNGTLIGGSGDNIWQGNITLTGATASINGSSTINGTSLKITGNVDLAGNQLTLTGNSAGNNEISGVISSSSGTGSLRKINGTGTWILSAKNTFTGGVQLDAGILCINNAQALGTSAGTFNINGGGPGYYNTVTIKNTSGADFTTVDYPINLATNLILLGSQNLNLGTGPITITGDRTITTSTNNLSLGGAISAPSSSLTKEGDGALNFGSNNLSLNNLLINGGSFGSTSGTLTLAGNFTNNRNYVHNSGTVTFNGTTTVSGTAITSFNNLVINSTKALTGHPSLMNVAGNWTNSGTFNHNNGTVSFNGASVNTITSTGSGSFYGMEINKPNNSLNLLSPITIAKKLLLTNGFIRSLSPTVSGQSAYGLLTIGAVSDTSGTSGIIGAGSSSYIIGQLKRLTNTAATGTYAFPVGDATSYKPLTFNTTTGLISGSSFTCEYFKTGYPVGTNDVFSGSLMGISSTEYWQFDRDNKVSGTNGVVILPYTQPSSWRNYSGQSTSPCGDCNVAVVQGISSNTWAFTSTNGNYLTTGTTPETRGYRDEGSISTKVLTSFSPFTFGFSYNNILVLPITLLSFEGRQANGNHLLDWTIAADHELAGFELQHSADGVQFSTLAKLAPAGTSYSYVHTHPNTGLHYYRLAITDKSGKTTYSQQVLLVNGKAPTVVLGLAQNPVGNQAGVKLYSATAQRVNIELTDINGRTISRSTRNLTAGQQLLSLPVGLLLPGHYFLTLTTGDGVRKTMKMIKGN